MSTVLGVLSVPVDNTCSGQLLVKAPIHVVKSLSSLAEGSCTYMKSNCAAISQEGALEKTASCTKAAFGCIGSCGARLLQVVSAIPTTVLVPVGWLFSVVEYSLCCCKRSPCIAKPSVNTAPHSHTVVQVQQPITPQTTVIQVQQHAAPMNTRTSSVTMPSSAVLPMVNPENMESSSSSATSKTPRSSTMQAAQMQQLGTAQATYSQPTAQISTPMNTRVSITLSSSIIIEIPESHQESSSSNASSKTARSSTMRVAKLGTADLQAQEALQRAASDQAASSPNESNNPSKHTRYDRPHHRPPDLLAEQRKAQKKNKLKAQDNKANNRKGKNDDKPKHRHVCSRTEPVNSAHYNPHFVNRFQKKEQDLALRFASEMSNAFNTPASHRSPPVLPSHHPTPSPQTLSAVVERDRYVVSRLVTKALASEHPGSSS